MIAQLYYAEMLEVTAQFEKVWAALIAEGWEPEVIEWELENLRQQTAAARFEQLGRHMPRMD